ncbi:MAG: hypothetical protein JXA72_04255 [Bacteroidales bacterium]|nr:hypothetical protein [Bacteroidales bacterium]
MDDRFEKFMSENRDSFDFREPDPRIWKQVEANMKVKRNFDWKLFMKRAAIVMLIFSASYVVNDMVHRYNGRGLQSLKPGKAGKENMMPGLKEAEAYYTGLVNQKLNELEPILANCPSLEEEVSYDMSELDSVYIQLKNDLKDNMANQEVIEAIIENYRLKISILEDLLKELEPYADECIPNIEGYAL